MRIEDVLEELSPRFDPTKSRVLSERRAGRLRPAFGTADRILVPENATGLEHQDDVDGLRKASRLEKELRQVIGHRLTRLLGGTSALLLLFFAFGPETKSSGQALEVEPAEAATSRESGRRLPTPSARAPRAPRSVPFRREPSPAGLIAYPDRDSQGRQQIFTIRADGTGQRQLTFEGDSGLPSWLPDGGRLFFTSIRKDPATQELRPGAWVMDADGSNQREILPYAIAADGSPDGTQIAYVFARGGGIWTADADGDNPVQLTIPATGASQIHPTWSWDGTRIAYVHVEPDTASSAGFHPEIWVMNADGTNRRLLTVADPDNLDTDGNEINTAHDANAPDWSPTDDRIAFWSGEEASNGQVWVINADGTGRKQLTEAPLPSHNDDPAWSADGKSILFSTDRSGGVHELWVMGADGTDERRIAAATAVPLPGDAAWQPVFSSADDSEGPDVGE